jgi:hypothetical protein
MATLASLRKILQARRARAGSDLLLSKRMRRGIKIAVSLIAVLLLVRPFDCFAAGVSSQKAAECCIKGKCAPTANSDECCKSSVPDRNSLVLSKAVDHSSPLIAFGEVQIPSLISPLTFQSLTDHVTHPPPHIGLTAPSLPLLI